MSVIADPGPPAGDPGPPTEDADAPTRAVLALGEDPDPPPGATRRMIIAFVVAFLVVAAVVALTVSGASREHRVTVVSSHSTPTSAVEHGFTLPQVGRKF
jgi:hypothetical protein